MKRRTKAEVDRIVKNLLDAVACTNEEEFNAWFDKTYPAPNSPESKISAEKKKGGETLAD